MSLRVGLRSESDPQGSGYRTAESIVIGGPHGGVFTSIETLSTVLGTGPGWLLLVNEKHEATELLNPRDVSSIWEFAAPTTEPAKPWPDETSEGGDRAEG